MVEDDASLRELYGTMLAEAGYEVECLATGAEAVERCAGGPVLDALIVDIQLEDTDGLAVARRVLEIHPGLPVVIHSAYPAYKGDFCAWCADAYVIKSTDCSALTRCLDRVLGRCRAGAENPR
jgi:DNA-binding response OmpR family regulator